MTKILLAAVLVLFARAALYSQAQMSSPPAVVAPNRPTAINIDDGVPKAVIELPKNNGEFPTLKFPSACDGNEVLKDVLDNVADPALVKQELAYESDHTLSATAIYKRRINLIKQLAGKK